jgi:hypothetical protein
VFGLADWTRNGSGHHREVQQTAVLGDLRDDPFRSRGLNAARCASATRRWHGLCFQTVRAISAAGVVGTGRVGAIPVVGDERPGLFSLLGR